MAPTLFEQLRLIFAAACLITLGAIVSNLLRSPQHSCFTLKSAATAAAAAVIPTKPKDAIAPVSVTTETFAKQNLSEIPGIVHQSWKTAQLPSNRSRRWRQSWRLCFPDWQQRLWTDADNRRLVSRHYPWFLATYDSLASGIQRADVSRYFYMFHYGGVYTDLDNICLENFQHLLVGKRVVFGGMTGLGGVQGTYVQNSLMASTPRHPFWMRMIIRIWMKFNPNNKGRPEFITGPYALMDEIKDFLNSERKGDVTIYPAKYFNPFSWYGKRPKFCDDLGRMTDQLERKCVQQLNGSYVVQLHVQSWHNGKM